VRITYPVIGSCNRLGFPRYLNTPSEGFGDVSPFRRFHSIAAFCGNGLRSEPQALFERLAVDPAFDTAARPQSTHSKRKLFTAFYTETYPDIPGVFGSVSVETLPVVHSVIRANIRRFSTAPPGLLHDQSTDLSAMLSTGCYAFGFFLTGKHRPFTACWCQMHELFTDLCQRYSLRFSQARTGCFTYWMHRTFWSCLSLNMATPTLRRAFEL
jgi:hypothetical protein